jgi:hypothetical protein
MAAVGFQGTAALGLGYLLTQRSLLDSFKCQIKCQIRVIARAQAEAIAGVVF